MKVVTALAAILSATSALAFEVRGIEPGKTTAKEAQKIVQKIDREINPKFAPAPGPWGENCRAYSDLPTGSPLKGYKSCAWYWRHKNERGEASSATFGPFELAGVPGHPGWDVDSKGVLQAFDFVFDSKNFERLKDAAIAKWGLPAKHQKHSLQNRMGATFENEVLVWSSETGAVWLYKFWPRGDSYKLDLSFLYIKTKQFITDDDKDTALRKTQKRRDF